MDKQTFINSCVAEARVLNREELRNVFSDNIQRIKDGDYGVHASFFIEQEEQRMKQALKEFDSGFATIFQSDNMHFGYGFYGEDV